MLESELDLESEIGFSAVQDLQNLKFTSTYCICIFLANMEVLGLVRPRRRSYDVIIDILRVALGGAKKTHIQQGANLNLHMLNTYLPYLLEGGLIVKDKDSYGNSTYRTTQKGRHAIKLYEEFRASLPKRGTRPT